jgi:two-component system sensor histidine kinase KdpD
MDKRPDPDLLLAALKSEAAQASQGTLKIFLGMCPGVGKTYAMLLAAQQRQEEGRKVVIGVIETHGRIETQALTAGLARVPRRSIEHRGVLLEEMDLDAILERKPDLVLVDELAHSNVAGGRHPKRWQDVVELIEAGIDVYTTLNVQHIESHRDVVAQITGAPMHESVPDSVIDRADEIELIDISPGQLLKRLEEGKIYLGDRAVAASDNFFREGNLKALREISLRITAEKADRELRDFMVSKRIEGPWKSKERFLVAVGASPFSEHLIRWTRRIATLTHGAWLAVYIDTGRPLGDAAKARLEKNLNLARTLGAEVLTASGEDVTGTLLQMAREHNVSQIVVGKPLSHPSLDLLRGGSLVDKLIRRSGDIDVYVVRAEKTEEPWRPNLQETLTPRLLREFGWSVVLVLAATIAGLLLKPAIGYMAVGQLYLFAVLLGSMALSRWPLLLAAALTAVAWNFLFITPYYTLYISNVHDLFLFCLYFIVALVMGHLSSRLRQREKSERRREEQATALYRFSRDIVRSRSLEEAIREGVRHIDELFGVTATVLAGPEMRLAAGEAIPSREAAVAAWSFDKKEVAGRFTTTLPQAERTYLPLRAGDSVAGVLGIKSRVAFSLPERQLLETFAAQIALLIEREKLTKEAEASRLEEKSRVLQKTLLDSVSHEFKTPLSVIATSAENLAARPDQAAMFIDEIRIAANRLRRIVENLLDITRIETGTVKPRWDWCDLREVFDAAMERARSELGGRKVKVEIEEAVGACRLDPGLLEEVLGNLLRNAAQNSPDPSEVGLSATSENGELVVRVIDEGPGVPEVDAGRIFEKFHRGEMARPGGLGLGLSIVKGFVEAQGGTISVAARKDGKSGAQFEIRLPVESKSMETIGA